MYPMPNIAAISIIQSNHSTVLVNQCRVRMGASSQVTIEETVSEPPQLTEKIPRHEGESVRDYLKRSFRG